MTIRHPLQRHAEYVADVIALVDRHGAARALELLADRPVPSARHRPHRTLTGYYVWAVDRLLSAGLAAWKVRWHPALHPRSPLSWYDRATLSSSAAHETFVPATIDPGTGPSPELPGILVRV